MSLSYKHLVSYIKYIYHIWSPYIFTKVNVKFLKNICIAANNHRNKRLKINYHKNRINVGKLNRSCCQNL